jgi:hypothetical protein
MLDTDGRFTYSNIIRFTNRPIGQLSVYPNPVAGKTTVQISDEKLMGTAAKIIDAAGKTVQTFIIKNNFEMLDMSLLPAGIYFLQTANGGNQKLIKE